MYTRRKLLKVAGISAAYASVGAVFSTFDSAFAEIPNLAPQLPAGVRGEAVMETLAGKKPLIKLTYRPPNYESPLDYFATPITPNDKFFVGYDLADISKKIDPKTWKLSIGGDGAKGTAELTLADLKALPAVTVVAVNQCSGNRRGQFEPHVPGVEWGYGAMGCAKWKGARLKDILAKVGLRADAIEIVIDGADKAVLDKTPDFVKSIPVSKALDPNTIIAYETNGEPIPHLNGAPARLIVPGWTGTYWMKHLVSVHAVTKPFEGFWMKSAYRIPVGKFPGVRFTSQESIGPNTPITEMVVNSLITTPKNGVKLKAGKTEVIDKDLGRYAFRPWSGMLVLGKGETKIMARATANSGEQQTTELIANPAGYHHNLYASVAVTVE